MLKNSILTLTLVLILSACASQRPSLSAVDGSAIPPAFAHFPDIPFPTDSFIDLDETRALGSGENWIGSLVYTRLLFFLNKTLDNCKYLCYTF